MSDFIKWAKLQGTPEKELPWMAKRIAQFGQFCKDNGLDAFGAESLRAYLLRLSNKQEDWQVHQAEKGVKLAEVLHKSKLDHLITGDRSTLVWNTPGG